MSDQPNFSADAFNSVWGRRALKLPEGSKSNAVVTHEAVDLLANRSVYIQVINSEAVLSGMTEPTFIGTEQEWMIHDYGEAMSVSQGDLLFEQMLDILPPEEHGKGTVVKQAVGVANQLIALAIDKKWAGIEIISGVRLMKWALWMAAEDHHFRVLGYEPNKAEKDKRERIKQLHTQAAAAVGAAPKAR